MGNPSSVDAFPYSIEGEIFHCYISVPKGGNRRNLPSHCEVKGFTSQTNFVKTNFSYLVPCFKKIVTIGLEVLNPVISFLQI